MRPCRAVDNEDPVAEQRAHNCFAVPEAPVLKPQTQYRFHILRVSGANAGRGEQARVERGAVSAVPFLVSEEHDVVFWIVGNHEEDV